MASNKVGPWEKKDYDAFLALNADPKLDVPNTLSFPPRGLGQIAVGDLDDAQFAKWNADRTQRAEATLKIGLESPVIDWLEKNSSFNKAWKVFTQERSNRRNSHKARLQAPTAQLIFLQEIVRHAGYRFKWQRMAVIKPKGYAKQRAQWQKIAAALYDEIWLGIQLDSYIETESLSVSLRKLLDKLENTKRKTYGGKKERERMVLQNFAASLQNKLGLSSPSIVMNFADMVGSSCSDTNAKRYCRKAKQDFQEQMRNQIASAMSTTRPTGVSLPTLASIMSTKSAINPERGLLSNN